MPRLVRRQPLIERLKSKLDPYDFLLWLSEELDSTWLEQFEKEWAFPAGIALNLVFAVARANSRGKSRAYDDVFGDDGNGGSLLAWVASFIVLILTALSAVNAVYTFWRKRHYRLFESSVDSVPSTPSASRVRVDSSPIASSPLRFLSTILGAENLQSRLHPDPSRDVWEIAVWDPLPACLRLFCLFSPGHVLIYWLFLPTATADPRPSTTVITSLLVALLLSVQLSMLQTNFSQQAKDSSLIHKEVLHEYDTKYVHPRTQPLYRDVSTQFTEQASYNPTRDEKYNVVETSKPMYVINRGFNPKPNPNYTNAIDPDGKGPQPTPSRPMSPTPHLPPANLFPATPSGMRDIASPLQKSSVMHQPQFRQSVGPGRGDGGSLGIYSHAQSPLRKSASTNFNSRGSYTNDYGRERSPEKRPSSPLKRSSVPAGMTPNNVSTLAAAQRWGHLGPGRRESGRF